MKKILLTLGIILLTSCSSYKLTNSVWYNLTTAELEGQTGDVITSIYFYEEGQMVINTCVKQDTVVIIPPTVTALGEYRCKKGKRHSVEIQLNLTDNNGLSENKKGIITKGGMCLFETDSVARVYFKASDLTLK